ncbi:unnamed protein product [Arctia plantaginis]|uniref:DALR anticodon binding domain-containing protein n=1 Tax=Arctia plantaginis TaxID=874455 RepID=A0A8S1B5S4_ARCPL|nr:unnamed protein product [Arctia plantaginis]
MTELVENALNRFTKNIIFCLTGEQTDVKGLLVKRHIENLQTHGDFSFPNSVKSWHDFVICDQVSDKENITFLEAINKNPEDIVEASKNWGLPVCKVKVEKARIYLFLQRSLAIPVGLLEALRNNSNISLRILRKCSTVHLDPLCEDNNDITSLRTKYVKNVIENICAVHNLNSSVFVTCKSTSKREGYSRVLCGTVLNAKTCAKETIIVADDFISKRQNEISLIAQHKYGVRVSRDSKWKEFIEHLGESAVAFELLQTKPSGAVKINFDNCAGGSTKGASFVLYNCARLESIIRTFNENVSKGTYPALPEFNDVDWSLLTDEDEWCLIFKYILGFPSLLDVCFEIKDQSCEFRPHHLCSFLCSMVREFSQYYRRVRILTEPRKHLLPVIFARIYMLKILNDALKTCLKILNIKSVSQM